MMKRKIKVTVGAKNSDFKGKTHFSIQSAIEYVRANGGGTVELAPGIYRLGGSVQLRNDIHLVGAGEKTVLFKNPSVTVPLIEDTDAFEFRITVQDSSAFRVGGGVLLQGKAKTGFGSGICKNTVKGIEGKTIYLSNQAGSNFWVSSKATAATLFSLICGYDVCNIKVSNLVLDGNRKNSAYLNGNFGGALFFQNCDRVEIDSVQSGNIESDALSFQTVHNMLVKNSQFINAVQGIHPGSGSRAPLIKNNYISKCSSKGISWCWCVKNGIAEGNIIEECKIGIDIGHRDTGNVMRNNTIRNCTEAGLHFRNDPRNQAANKNIIENNYFENIGTDAKPRPAINIEGSVDGNIVRHNRIVCTKKGIMSSGIFIGPQVTNLIIKGNKIKNIKPKMVDLRAKQANLTYS